MVTLVGRATLFERVYSVLDCLASFLWVRGGSVANYRAAFCPKKTRATFIWRFSYLTPLRSTAPMRQRAKLKPFSARYQASNTPLLLSGSAFSASFNRPIA